MKLQQLRYAVEVYRQNLSVSAAADALFTSQSGISKQIRLLEEELGVALFVRHGKRLVALTPPGKVVLEAAERILREVQRMKTIATEFADQDTGILRLAAPPTQARYALPPVVSAFVRRYPQVSLSMVPANATALNKMVLDGEVDFAIGTEWGAGHADLCRLGCYPWNRSVVLPDGHDLLHLRRPLQLSDLAAVPLMTDESVFEKDAPVAKAFAQAGLTMPPVVLASADTDVIKTHVRLGLGVGLIATTAFDVAQDAGLSLLSAEHLFAPSFSHIVLRRDAYLRSYAYAFLQLFANKLTRAYIDAALYAPMADDFSI